MDRFSAQKALIAAVLPSASSVELTTLASLDKPYVPLSKSSVLRQLRLVN